MILSLSSNSCSLRRTWGMGRMESQSHGLTPKTLAFFDHGTLPVPRMQHRILHDRGPALPLRCAHACEADSRPAVKDRAGRNILRHQAIGEPCGCDKGKTRALHARQASRDDPQEAVRERVFRESFRHTQRTIVIRVDNLQLGNKTQHGSCRHSGDDPAALNCT